LVSSLLALLLLLLLLLALLLFHSVECMRFKCS
jgi:hypothetical protein